MMKLVEVPVAVFQGFAMYAKGTGEEVYINNAIVGDDGRVFIHKISVEDDELKFTPVYLTSDVQEWFLDRCAEDLVKVEKFTKEEAERLHSHKE